MDGDGDVAAARLGKPVTLRPNSRPRGTGRFRATSDSASAEPQGADVGEFAFVAALQNLKVTVSERIGAVNPVKIA